MGEIQSGNAFHQEQGFKKLLALANSNPTFDLFSHLEELYNEEIGAMV
jgi:hypothetical protein